MAELNIDLSNTADISDGGDDVLPAGEYVVKVWDTEIKTARMSGIDYLHLTLRVSRGDYQGRNVYDNFFLWHDNARWAREKLKSLRKACGLNPNVGGNTDELLNREVLIQLKVKDRRDGQGKENQVKVYKACERPAAPVAPVAAPAPSPVAASAPAPSPVFGSETTAAAPGAPYPW